jgi:glycosyltransferase involved in cell wall biosynthesis
LTRARRRAGRSSGTSGAEPVRLLLLARSLETGGAERQLVALAGGLDPARFAVTVAILYDRGPLRAEVAGLPGVRLVALGKAGRWDLAGPLLRLVRLIRRERIEAVYGSLDIANLYGLAGGRLGGARVVFGVRSSCMDFSRYDRSAGAVWRAVAAASRAADLVVYNSFAGRDWALSRGFSRRNAAVVPNGIDLSRFHPDPEGGRRVRAAWGIAPESRLVGLVGRLDPMKDHATFLRAAALVRGEETGVRFVCVGEGPEGYAQGIRALAVQLGLERGLVWAGARADMPAVYAALDVLALSSSFGEGFPNVVGEAMACGVPCAVTDVGDAARIVGGEGVVVPPEDPPALAAGLRRLLAEPAGEHRARGVRCRERIAAEFPLASMVAATGRELLRVLGVPPVPGATPPPAAPAAP